MCLTRAGRDRGFSPWSLVFEELNFASASQHDLKTSIRFSNVVQPRGNRDVLGEPHVQSAFTSVLSRNRFDPRRVFCQGNGSSRMTRVVAVGRHLNAILN
jgi:hypothetical protein